MRIKGIANYLFIEKVCKFIKRSEEFEEKNLN